MEAGINRIYVVINRGRGTAGLGDVRVEQAQQLDRSCCGAVPFRLGGFDGPVLLPGIAFAYRATFRELIEYHRREKLGNGIGYSGRPPVTCIVVTRQECGGNC